MSEEIKKVNDLKSMIINEINNANDLVTLKAVADKHLSKKSELNSLMSLIKQLSGDEKTAFGQAMNNARKELNELYQAKERLLNEAMIRAKLEKEKIDITLPGIKYNVGGINPFFKIIDEMVDIFTSMGYQVKEGPDVETDYFNFERMNIPSNHPAREMQDSFYIDNNTLLRTHTSPAQAHAMDEADAKPLKIICPGKCYRRDDDDATHSHQFGQIEGLVIGKGINLGNLKATLELFLRKMFGEKREVRFRSSYFPFTEPSVEVDISCMECQGKGCSICKGTGYIEILGAGMVHPNVLRMSGYDPEVYSGFAFGVGIERVAMLRYGIDDIRKIYQGDVRFVEQFKRK
ncbi:MAG: phenylalanine--tRNA ligase subunit alpha [Bacilli bacterium]|nr:phenylalanine--tRNA ligase subunit alpha [Bacilli bacterium]